MTPYHGRQQSYCSTTITLQYTNVTQQYKQSHCSTTISLQHIHDHIAVPLHHAVEEHKITPYQLYTDRQSDSSYTNLGPDGSGPVSVDVWFLGSWTARASRPLPRSLRPRLQLWGWVGDSSVIHHKIIFDYKHDFLSLV